MSLALSLDHVHNPHPGWYRGDFHCHTNQSDGVHLPPELVDVARREGLDFFAITDHNAVSAYGMFGPDPGVLIIPGIEATYKRGHFNVFGLTEDGAWLQQVCSGYVPAPAEGDPYPTVNALLRQTAASGLLNSINHPLLAPWAWEFPDTDLDLVHCLEIWNDPSWPDNDRDNPRAVALWTRWLNAGYRITALGGSDYHRPHPPPGQDKAPERLGLPSTYVYAENLSGRAILDAVRQGRAYVSMGPRVTFEARHAGGLVGIGADLGTVSGEVTFLADVQESGAPGWAQIVKNGRPQAQAGLVDGGAMLSARVAVDPAEPAWFRLEVWAAEDRLLAMTNPIFAGPARAPARRQYGDYL